MTDLLDFCLQMPQSDLREDFAKHVRFVSLFSAEERLGLRRSNVSGSAAGTCQESAEVYRGSGSVMVVIYTPS